MTTSSHAAPAARGPTGPIVFNGVEAPYTVLAGIGDTGDYGNEAGFVRVAANRGLSSPQPQIDVEELADAGLFTSSAVAGGAP